MTIADLRATLPVLLAPCLSALWQKPGRAAFWRHQAPLLPGSDLPEPTDVGNRPSRRLLWKRGGLSARRWASSEATRKSGGRGGRGTSWASACGTPCHRSGPVPFRAPPKPFLFMFSSQQPPCEGSHPRVITMDSAGHPSMSEIILLATSSAVTAILYAVYRHRSKVADSLKGAKKVTLDQDLKNLLMEAPGKCVPYAVIEGVVRSVKESLNSQFVDSCKGVVQRLTLQEHKMVWNRTTHIWNDYEKIIHQRTNTVPFDLVALGSEGPPEVAVRVLKPLSAAELSLETVYERFHPSVQSLTDAIGHYISGERPKGIKETEQMLTVGAALTGIGELVLESSTIKLQPPKQGLRYCLSSLGFETLLEQQESSVRFWKILATLCGLASCALLLFVLHKQYRCQREKRRLRQMLEGMAAGGDGTNACMVCLGNSRACVFLECGHVCSCLKCYEALPRPPCCPICRQLISRVVPLYNS